MYTLVAILGYLSLVFFFHLFKKHIDSPLAFFIVGFLGTNWFFMVYSTRHILSDIPYLFFSAFTLFMAHCYLEHRSVLNLSGVLVILGLVLSYFTRYVGITLFVGTVVTLLLASSQQKIKKIILISGGFIIPFLIWQIVARNLNPSSLSLYSNQFFLIDPYRPFLGTIFASPKYLLFRFVQGVNYYYKIIGSTMFPYFARGDNLGKEILSILFTGLIFLGLWLKFRENKASINHYYFLFYFFLIVLWPFREGARFILPILPLMFFYFSVTVKKIITFLSPKISYPALYILFSVLLIFNILFLPTEKYTYQRLPQPFKNFISLHHWIKENLPKEGIVVSRKPTLTYFFAYHKAVGYPFTRNPEEIAQAIVKNNAKYVVVDEFSRETYRYLLPFLYQYRGKLKLLHRVGNTGVFEVALMNSYEK